MESAGFAASTEIVQWIKSAVNEVFNIESIAFGRAGDGSVRVVGQFLISPDEAYRRLEPRFRDMGYVLMFRREGNAQAIIAVPGRLPTSVKPSVLNLVLLILTVLSTLYVGTAMISPEPSDVIRRPWLGLPFALSLLVILGAHELGHYVAARQYGVPVTLPYFIPMPFGPFGTLGAFISMKAPPPNRRALLAVAAAGPLSGFVLAVPILLLGLSMSPITPLGPSGNVIMEGNSILYALIKIITFGRFLPSGGQDVFLHPIAFAGWAGLLVTGLNLLPVGQLDGGHIMYALLGNNVRYFTWPIIGALVLLGMVWNGWFLWAILLLFFGRSYAAPLDELTPLTPAQRAIGWLVVIIFILVFTPLPLTVY